MSAPKVTFKTTVREARPGVTGFKIPADIIAQLGTSKKPPVKVTLAGYTYQSTVAVYGEDFLLPLSVENREAGLESPAGRSSFIYKNYFYTLKIG